MFQFKIECIVCGQFVHFYFTIRLIYKNVYCKLCLKFFFLRVIKDENFFSLICYRQLIDISIIETNFSIEDLIVYRNVELEFINTNKIYCVDSKCVRFIFISQRTSDCIFCKICNVQICIHCKVLIHDEDYSTNETKQGFINFANKQNWKLCFECDEMMFRYKNCDYII